MIDPETLAELSPEAREEALLLDVAVACERAVAGLDATHEVALDLTTLASSLRLACGQSPLRLAPPLSLRQKRPSVRPVQPPLLRLIP